jgi:hypothetical protein
MSEDTTNLPVVIQPANAEQVQAGGKWKKGQSGNPRGKAKGTGNPIIRLLRQKSYERKEELTEAVLEGVKLREPIPMKIWADRFLPLLQCIDPLPELREVETAQDIAHNVNVILAAARDGRISVQALDSLTKFFAGAANVMYTADLERRLTALEQTK